jgi:hypothetical protein
MTHGSQELDMAPMEKVHFIISLVGMCLITFISPPLIEVCLNLNLTDFEQFIQQRRAAIKAIALAYIRTRKSTA